MLSTSNRLLILGLGLVLDPAFEGSARGAEALSLTVRETAGIRRFGYPVDVELRLPRAVAVDTSFRLVLEGKPISAQFRPEPGRDVSDRWWLDFPISLAPRETRSFRIEYGRDVEAGPETQGLTLDAGDDGRTIRNGDSLSWTIGDSVDEVLTSVKFTVQEQLRDGNLVLSLRAHEGETTLGKSLIDAGDNAWRVHRSGPYAVELRSEGRIRTNDGASALSELALHFPATKSWIRVDWRVSGDHRSLRAMSARFVMNLERPSAEKPILADFGATSWTYAALTEGEIASLVAGRIEDDAARPLWRVLKGAAADPGPFVDGPVGAPKGADVEGWSHLMDETRCLALAVDRFARDASDAITVGADGLVRIDRGFPERADSRERSLRFWLHFVTNPPHVSAATSPQAMRAPLEVVVGPPNE